MNKSSYSEIKTQPIVGMTGGCIYRNRMLFCEKINKIEKRKISHLIKKCQIECVISDHRLKFVYI